MAFDGSNPTHLQELNTEVTTDPTGIGYNPAEINAGVIDPINLARATITVQKSHVSAAEIRSATTRGAYDALTADEQEWIRWQTGSNGFQEENVVVTADLRLQLLGDGGTSFWAPSDRAAMEAAMTAIFDRDGSRAEQLWGIGSFITRDDWINARDL